MSRGRWRFSKLGLSTGAGAVLPGCDLAKGAFEGPARLRTFDGVLAVDEHEGHTGDALLQPVALAVSLHHVRASVRGGDSAAKCCSTRS